MRKIYLTFFLFIIVSCTTIQHDEHFWITNTKNEKIYIEVSGKDNAAYHKLAILEHGLASNMNHQAIQAAKRAFLEHQYVVITFDARHSLGNGDNNVMAVSLDSFEDDLKTVIAWAKKQPYYHEPFALAGHSLGGAAVLQYSAKNPEKVGILVPITPVISGKLWEKSCMENMQDFCKKWQQEGFYEYTDSKNHKTALIPYRIINSSMIYDANKLAKTITAQTLLIAAQNDIVIDADELINLGNKISNSRVVTISSGGHNFETPQNQTDLYEAITTFLQ